MRLRWATEARHQLVEVRSYIEQGNPRAAMGIVRAIREAAERLAEFPESGWLDPRLGVRVCTVPRTPYRLIYVVEHDGVRIVSVWHGACQWPPARD